MIFKIHTKNLSIHNNRQFSYMFNNRGASSLWKEDIIWSYFIEYFNYRYYYWK